MGAIKPEGSALAPVRLVQALRRAVGSATFSQFGSTGGSTDPIVAKREAGSNQLGNLAPDCRSGGRLGSPPPRGVAAGCKRSAKARIAYNYSRGDLGECRHSIERGASAEGAGHAQR